MCSRAERFPRQVIMIFVLYFCFFTISTLSFAGIHESINESIPHLYLLELIGSKITEGRPERNTGSPLHLPLFKKKAVLPAESSIKNILVKNQWLVSYIIFLLKDNSCCHKGQDILTLTRVQLSPFHSGVSPPDVHSPA